MTIPPIESFRTPRVLERGLRTSFARLASGRRVLSAADDPGSLGLIERLRTQEAALLRGVHNLDDGRSASSVAEGGLASISGQIGRLRELSIQAQNGTLNDADRELIQIEFDSLTAEISRTAQSTEFNGRNLLNGDISGPGALTLTDAFGSDLSVDLDDHSASALGLEGLSVSDPDTLAALDDALQQVSTSRASLGATINTIDHRVQSQRQHALNVAESRSRIEDADVAAEIANLVRNQQLVKAHSGLTASFLKRTTGMLDLLT